MRRHHGPHLPLEPWQPANNGAGKHIWFVCRRITHHPTGMPYEYHENDLGHLICYKSWGNALQKAGELNELEKRY